MTIDHECTTDDEDERWRSPFCSAPAPGNAPCPKCWLAWFLPPPDRCDNRDHLESFMRAELYRLRRECDEAIARATSAEFGCEIAYRREPTQEEGDAHEVLLPVDSAAMRLGECFVPMGSWEGRRCHECKRWEWAPQSAGWWATDARVLCATCAKETP